MLWEDSWMQNATHGQVSDTAHVILWVEKQNPLFCSLYYVERISSLVVEKCSSDEVNERSEPNNEHQI